MRERTKINILDYITISPELALQDWIDLEHPLWQEFFLAVEQNRPRGNFLIYQHDLPLFRDLKAFFNVCLIRERLKENYVMWTVAAFKQLERPGEIYTMYTNINILNSTKSVIGDIFWAAEKLTREQLLPLAYKLAKKHLTEENIDYVTHFLIEKYFKLERYEQEYKERQSKKVSADTKTEPKESIVRLLVKKNDEFLQRIYKKEYETIFLPNLELDQKAAPQAKDLDRKVTDQLDFYYPEKKTDKATEKQLKLLLNGFLAFDQTLRDVDSYKKTTSTVSGLTWGPTLISDAMKCYSYFSQFNYREILVDKANPIVKKIRRQIKKIDPKLEQLACWLDRAEEEFYLKDKVLLNYLSWWLEKYKVITSDLNIPIDYVAQRRTYLPARIKNRKKRIEDVTKQINELREILKFKDYTLAAIPNPIIHLLQRFITTYDYDICTDRDDLETYKKYLIDAQAEKIGLKLVLLTPFEQAGNYLGVTIHSKIMAALANMYAYLQKTKLSLENRLQKTHAEPRFDFFKESLTEKISVATMIEALEKRANELNAECEALRIKALTDLGVEIDLKQENTSTKSDKKTENLAVDVKEGANIKQNVPDQKGSREGQPDSSLKSIKPTQTEPTRFFTERKIGERVTSQNLAKTKELAFFSTYISNSKKEGNNFFALITALKKEEHLSPPSILLLDEITTILTANDSKLIAEQPATKTTPLPELNLMKKTN